MKKKYNYFIIVVLIALSKLSFGQVIYQHNFGTSTFTAVNPYGVAPTTIDANLSGSQWATSFASGFSSLAGSAGQALSLSNSGGTPTYSLSFTVGSGFNCDITAFSFWRQRSTAGAQNWTLTVNGVITIGNGTVPTAGISTGTLLAANPANGLSGTVNVVLQLSGATSTGTFRLDDFTLYGSTYPVSGCATPTLQASSFGTSGIGNNSAVVSWVGGSGGNVLVLARQSSPVNSAPISGLAYTANSVFASGQQIGTGNYVVYNGSGTFVNVTGLSPALNYYFSVFEYNTTSGTPCYLVPALTGSLTTTGTASGLQIKSILVDACNGSGSGLGVSEPYNEMVFFRSGSGAIPIAQLSIAGKGNTGGFQANKWPNLAQGWHGLVQNANTAAKVSALNATIVGCGFIREPVGGIIPANSDIIMVTSQYLNTTYNSFTNLNDSIYVVFQDTVSDAVQGHFANYSATPGNRSLRIIDNANGFTDSVTYNISLLSSHNDGDAVDFDTPGNATYVNRGCQAPFIPLSVDAGVNQNVCFNGTAALTATVSGTYNSVTWSGGAGSFVNNSILSTTYTPGAGETGIIKLYCTISNNCPPKLVTTKDSVLLTILQLPLATINASNGYSLCPSATSVMSYSVTNPSFASVVTPGWSSPSGSGTTYTVSSPSGTASVTYSLNLTNACGNSLNTFTVYPLALPTVTLSATTLTACVGNTVSLLATGNTNNFSWNNPVSTNSTVTLTANTTTTGVVTSTNSCGSAFDTYTLTVTQNPVLTVDNPNPTLCAGQSATITATSSSGTYTWMPNAVNTNSIVVNSASTHTVFTENVCNSVSVAVNVVVNATPTLSISTTSNSLCAGGQTTSTLSLVGSTGTYTWSTGVNTSTISISTPGVYTATVDAGLCGITSASITIDVLVTPTISVSSTSTLLCDGATATLTASGNLSNFSWSDGSTNTPMIVVTATGLYSVSVSNACGTPSASVNILTEVTPTLNVVSTSSTICSGSTATLTVTGGAMPYTWSNSASTGSVVTTNGGTVSVSSSNTCGSDTKTISVSIIPNPTVTLVTNSYTACPGDIIDVIANSSENNYSWSNSAITTATLSLTASSSTTGIVTTTNVCTNSSDSYTITVINAPTIVVDLDNINLCTGQSATITAISSIGNYTWMPGGITTNTLVVNSTDVYTVTTSNACYTVIATSDVVLNSLPVINLISSSSTICPNETATLTATGGTEPYAWSNTASTGSVVTSTGGAVTVSNTNGCGTASQTINVTVVNLNASFSAIPMSGIKPVVVDFANNSSGASGYAWNFGNGNSAVTQTVSSQTYSVVGTYTVYLLVTNGSCSDIDSLTIQVLNEAPTLIIPNVFTPNNDSVNDVFRVTGFNIIEFNCTIFDRWGIQLFYWNDITKGWDGKSGGKEVPDGTYFYIINAKDIDAKEIKKQGHISLFK